MIHAFIYGSKTCGKCKMIKKIFETQYPTQFSYIDDPEELKRLEVTSYPEIRFVDTETNEVVDVCTNRDSVIVKCKENLGK